MEKSSKRQEKERLAAVLGRIYRKFAFSSQSEMARAMGLSQPTLSRAMNCLNAVLMEDEKRLQVAQFLGQMCENREELRILVEEVSWEMKEAEWQAALASLGGDEWDLPGVPYLWTEYLVGRIEEVEILQAWMLDERRTVEPILVVQGVGGVGKTILALQAVRQQAVKEWYQKNIFWVDVEQYGEAGGVRQLAYQVGGESALQAEDPRHLVKEALRGKRALVLLDGVEEGINLDRWADLLPPRGRLLVTTRMVGVTGTRVGTRTLKLTGLASDAAHELLTRDVVVNVSAEDLAWVVDVVDGSPLALYIGNTIGQREGGLSGFVSDLRTRGLDTLHIEERKERSMRVTFESSYQRMDEKSQMLFRALGVFLPRFKVDAVAAILGLSEGSVRRRLRQLMQAGLVDNVGPGEYRMHNLVYRYAAELGQVDERWQEWQGRFAAYYLALAREAGAAGDLETIGEHLAEFSQGAVCAMALRDRATVMDYVHCVGVYVSIDESAADVWQERVMDQVDEGKRAEMTLRTARFCQETGRTERALKLAREARAVFEATEHGREWVDASLVIGEAKLAMGHGEEAVGELREQALWERMARLDDSDDLLFRAWALSEKVQTALGRDVGCEEQTGAARTRWLASQPSPEQAQLRLLRNGTPLDEDTEKALRALEKRMELADRVEKRDWWITDALRRASLLVRQGKVAQAETALAEIEEREAEFVDDRFWPWVCLLRACMARAAGRDEEAEQEYRAAVETLAEVFGETALWPVDREGIAGETVAERAFELWQRALQVDDPFRHIEVTCRAYPLFAWLERGSEDEDEEDRRALYRAAQEEMKPLGLEVPDWDWLVAEDDAIEGELPEKHPGTAQP